VSGPQQERTESASRAEVARGERLEDFRAALEALRVELRAPAPLQPESKIQFSFAQLVAFIGPILLFIWWAFTTVATKADLVEVKTAIASVASASAAQDKVLTQLSEQLHSQSKEFDRQSQELDKLSSKIDQLADRLAKSSPSK